MWKNSIFAGFSCFGGCCDMKMKYEVTDVLEWWKQCFVSQEEQPSRGKLIRVSVSVFPAPSNCSQKCSLTSPSIISHSHFTIFYVFHTLEQWDVFMIHNIESLRVSAQQEGSDDIVGLILTSQQCVKFCFLFFLAHCDPTSSKCINSWNVLVSISTSTNDTELIPLSFGSRLMFLSESNMPWFQPTYFHPITHISTSSSSPVRRKSYSIFVRHLPRSEAKEIVFSR